jgi:hypothetical protein
MPTPNEQTTPDKFAEDVSVAYNALSRKKTAYDLLWSYYEGDHPLVYSTERLQKAFRSINARFSENWCAVIVDSVLERLNLKAFLVPNDQNATDLLNYEWQRTEMALDADDTHLGALVTGESFVIVWRDAPDQPIEAYYNDPRLCYVQYDPESPRIKRWASKWWTETDGRYHLTMYYPDRLCHYKSSSKEMPSSANGFKLEDEELNPYEMIPVFHFRTNRRTIKGELNKALIEQQDAINKLLADMMISAEYGAFKQRWIISNSDAGGLKNAPDEIWELPAGDGRTQPTTVGEFTVTELKNYTDAIDRMANAMGVISRTPKHYFYAQGGDPSGEALLAMEAPLNHKVERYVERYSSTWKQVANFILTLSGYSIPDLNSIIPVFTKPQTTQPRTQAEIRQMNVNAGIPLITTLRNEGWTDQELDKMAADKKSEAADRTNSLAMALMEQQRRFDQGAGETTPNGDAV